MVATATITIIVDDEDADLLQWTSNLRNTQVRIAQVIAHRVYGPKPVGYHVDHVDNDWTNNRRNNLDYIPATDNLKKERNIRQYGPRGGSRIVSRRSKYGYYGIQKHRDGWVATVTHRGIKYTKFSSSPEQAARYYDSIVLTLGLDKQFNYPIVEIQPIDINTVGQYQVKKSGQPVVIRGVTYPTRKEAAQALGITRQRIEQLVNWKKHDN